MAPLKLGYKGSSDWQHNKLMNDRYTRITPMANPMSKKLKICRNPKEQRTYFIPGCKPKMSKP